MERIEDFFEGIKIPSRYVSPSRYVAHLKNVLEEGREEYGKSPAYLAARNFLENGRTLTARELGKIQVDVFDSFSVVTSLQLAYLSGLEVQKEDGVSYRFVPRKDLEYLQPFFKRDINYIATKLRTKGAVVEKRVEGTKQKGKIHPLTMKERVKIIKNGFIGTKEIREAAGKFLDKNKVRKWKGF